DPRAFAEIGAGTQPREGPDAAARPDDGAFDMAEGVDHGSLPDPDAGAEDNRWLDHDVAGDLGVPGEVDSGRIVQGNAGGHELLAPHLLEELLGARELRPVIDPHYVAFGRDGVADAIAGLVGELDQVGQVELALRIV